MDPKYGSLAARKGLALLLALSACSAPPVARDSPPVAEPAPATSLPGTTSTTAITTTTLPPLTTTTVPTFEGGIEEVSAARLGHSWREGCPIDPTQLRLVSITHWGFDGEPHRGELVVHVDQSVLLLRVFENLFDAAYPIESVIPIGDLPEDAEDNPGYANTSVFNCRSVAGTSRWSEHALGRAIDINPLQNPFVSSNEIWPEGSEEYSDRDLAKPGMILDGDVVVAAFAAIGWEWGGHWRSLKDYHHFSSTGR